MKVIISLVIVAVLVGAVALFGLVGGNSEQDVSGTTEAVEMADQAEESKLQTFLGEGSLLDVQNFGVNVECRISYDDPELLNPVIGTYFVSRGRIRGDFQMNVPELGGETVSSIIVSDDMFYSWSNINGESYGVKFAADTPNMDNSVVKEPVPSDARVSYDCTEWRTVDNSIFEPPSEVLFQDMSNLMNSGMEYGTIYEDGEF